MNTKVTIVRGSVYGVACVGLICATIFGLAKLHYNARPKHVTVNVYNLEEETEKEDIQENNPNEETEESK